MYFYHDILWPAIKATKCLVWNSDIQGSFKKFSLLFGQAETIFVIVCFFDHFMLKTISSVNGICMVAFVNHLHVWLTKFKPSFIIFKLSVLKSNNVIWMNFSAILFDETQHVVKTSTTSCAPVYYETINLFIESQNFLLMASFVSSRTCIWLSFSSMAEANFRTSRGKTVSTTQSMNGSALGFLERRRKQ